MKHIDVKFNAFRWVVFFTAILIGWVLAKQMFETRLYRILGGTIVGLGEIGRASCRERV